MAEKPRNEKLTTVENFYTKKILEKEEQIKSLQEELFNLQNFSTIKENDKNKIKIAKSSFAS